MTQYISNTFYLSQAASLRKQVEGIKKERAALGIEVDSPCGPGAPCRARLEAMEFSHRKTLQELQENHAREVRELEEERDRMLQEESQAAAKGKPRNSIYSLRLPLHCSSLPVCNICLVYCGKSVTLYK